MLAQCINLKPCGPGTTAKATGSAGESGLHEFEFTECGGGVDILTGMMDEQILGDFPPTGVRRGLLGCFEITSTPIPTCVDEQRSRFDEVTPGLQTTMGLTHGFAHLILIERRWFCGRLVGARLGWVCYILRRL